MQILQRMNYFDGFLLAGFCVVREDTYHSMVREDTHHGGTKATPRPHHGLMNDEQAPHSKRIIPRIHTADKTTVCSAFKNYYLLSFKLLSNQNRFSHVIVSKKGDVSTSPFFFPFKNYR